MNLSFRQLKAFTLVAQLGNFTRASERMHITQAGLSVMMGELEKQLGTRLFDRTTRAVALTPAGTRFLPAALAALEQLEAAAAELADFGQQQRQTLRLAASPMVSSSLLPMVFGSFRKTYPQVDIQLVDCALPRVHTLVESGEVDFGMGFFLENKRGVDRLLLYSFHLMRLAPLSVAASSCTNDNASVPWSALQDAAMISLPADNLIQQLVDAHLPKPERPAAPGRSFSHVDTIIAMVAAGMGTAVLPTFATQACKRYEVRTNVLTQPEVTLGLYRITKRGRPLPPFLEAFTATMVEVLPQLAQPRKPSRDS
jgi:DNA-binding transcriptional LysR family regulator